MKRKLSLLMVLMMVLSLVPANFAFAASDSIVNTVTTSADGTVSVDLNIEAKGSGITGTVASPGVFEVRLGDNAEWTNTDVLDPTAFVVSGVPAGTVVPVRATSKRVEFEVYSTIVAPGAIRIQSDVKLSGASGEQRLTVEDVLRSGITRQVLPYAIVSGTGNVFSRALESKKSLTRTTDFGAEFEIREATRDGFTLNEDLVLRLPRDVVWESGTTLTVNGNTVSPTFAAPATSAYGTRELRFSAAQLIAIGGINNSSIDRIVVRPQITITRDARLGDIEVEVIRGISADPVVVAEYVDFGITVEVDKTKQIIAGRTDTNSDYEVKVTLDPAGNSFNTGRFIDFTVDGGKVKLKNSIPATQATGSTITTGSYKDEFEMRAVSAGQKIEMTFYVQADWDKSGEMTLTVEGGGVDKQTVKIADVLAPATIEVREVKDLKIGVQGQTGSEIVIRETAPGSLREGYYVIDFDRANFGVTFTRPTATVTTGNIEVGRNITRDGRKIWLQVESESTRNASEIVLSGYNVSLDRTVAEGPLEAKFAWVKKAMDNTVDPAVELAWTNARRDMQVEDVREHSKITNFVIGKVVTAAPDAQRPTTVFTIGSTVFTVAGQEMNLDAAPYISNNRTMLPIGTVAQVVGATVNYSSETRTAVFQKDNLVVSMNLDTNVLLVNGVPVMMDAKPEIVNSRAFVPVVFVAQAFGIQNNTEIVYDAATRTVTMFPGQ